MNSAIETTQIQSTIDALCAAWKAGDGARFAAKCTDDVDFVNLLGMHVRGREAVAAMHDTILHGPYAGSTLQFDLERIRPISGDAVVVLAPSCLTIPAGPVAGEVRSIATILFVRKDGNWNVAGFHNTRRYATNPDHYDIMAALVTSRLGDGGPKL